MKTETSGCGGRCVPSNSTSMKCAAAPWMACALKNYKDNRENDFEALAKNSSLPVFPSSGFESLDITDWGTQSGKRPDSQGRYWYKLTLRGGRVEDGFYYEEDKTRGSPKKDARGNDVWWFIIGHSDGTRITGFCQEPDYSEGFPREDGWYYYNFKFYESECAPIRQWMEAKDALYLNDLKANNPALYGQEIADLKAKNPAHPYFQQLAVEEAKAQEEQRLQAAEKGKLAAESERLRAEEAKQRLQAKSLWFAEPWSAFVSDDKGKLGDVPKDYYCPITCKIMVDPVFAMDEHTYEREAIEQYIQKASSASVSTAVLTSKLSTSSSSIQSTQVLSPMTNLPLPGTMVFPNHAMRSMIRDFLDKNPSNWEDVYLTENQRNTGYQMVSGKEPIDVQRFEELLRSEPRLLYKPLGSNNPGLLKCLSTQTREIVQAYLPIIFSLLKANDWKRLIAEHSIQTWLISLSKTCDKADTLPLLRDYLPRFEGMMDVTLKSVSWVLLAVEKQELALFKLFLPSVAGNINQVIDDEGNTLLHITASLGSPEMLEVLVKAGGDLKQRNHAGLKPEAVARQAQQPANADCIGSLKLTPALERMGIFTMFKRFDALEQRNDVLVRENQELRTEVQQLRSQLEALSPSPN